MNGMKTFHFARCKWQCAVCCVHNKSIICSAKNLSFYQNNRNWPFKCCALLFHASVALSRRSPSIRFNSRGGEASRKPFVIGCCLFWYTTTTTYAPGFLIHFACKQFSHLQQNGKQLGIRKKVFANGHLWKVVRKDWSNRQPNKTEIRFACRLFRCRAIYDITHTIHPTFGFKCDVCECGVCVCVRGNVSCLALMLICHEYGMRESSSWLSPFCHT